MDAELTAAILKVVSSIPDRHHFDTHVVIQKLDESHPAIYRQYVAGKNLAEAHAAISCVVRDSGMVTRALHQSYSRTINGSYDSVACWLKTPSVNK